MSIASPTHSRTGYLLALAVLLLDQAIKLGVTYVVSLPRIGTTAILPFFSLTWVENYGVSFGLFRADSELGRWLLVAFTSAIAIAVFVWLRREKVRGDALALGLVLGGALGNIIDRVRVGYVIDYADLHFGDFRPFLVFNVADAAITIGVLLLVARALLLRDKATGERSTDQGAAAPEGK
jgi:signal peptidase II